ncbi:MAG: PQQ-binding-like beta-propeller repeat protein [Bacteroidales bacterium]|nr:PQQ-binding-like beta-propeller repeat protein [Bacteroidales bacterium]
MVTFTRKEIFFAGALSFLLMIWSCEKEKPDEPLPPETTGTVSGNVINAADGSAVGSANITADPGGYCVYTDNTGSYMLADLPGGQYFVIASKEGFCNDSADVSVVAGQTVTADFLLTPEFNIIKWQLITDKPVYYSTPAIDDEGIIYVGTGIYLWTTSGSLYAVKPDGTLKWRYDLDNNATSPVIGEDGTIYIMDRKNVLYALDRGGILKWRYNGWDNDDFAEVGQRTVAIGYDNTLYVFVGLDLYAVNPDGSRKWKFDPGRGGTPCGASPVVGSDSTIYAILGGEVLYAVRPDGTLKWEFYLEKYDEHSFTSPTLDENDVIYFGTENGEGGYVYAVYPNGILKWRILAGSLRPVRASPVIGMDGTVYVATKAYSHRQPAEVLAVSPDGKIKWRYTVESIHFTPDDVYSTPAVGADSLIYFAAETGFIYALNPDGTLNWKQDLECGINWSSPTLIDDGTIYIGGLKNDGGSLFALQSGSPGLARSPWPTFRQNNKNTGRYDEF